jgi:hypothetical protein
MWVEEGGDHFSSPAGRLRQIERPFRLPTTLMQLFAIVASDGRRGYPLRNTIATERINSWTIIQSTCMFAGAAVALLPGSKRQQKRMKRAKWDEETWTSSTKESKMFPLPSLIRCCCSYALTAFCENSQSIVGTQKDSQTGIHSKYTGNES